MSGSISWSKLYYSAHALEQFSVKETNDFGSLRLEIEIDGNRYRYWSIGRSGFVFIDILDRRGQWTHFGAYDGYQVGEQPSGSKSL